MTPHNNPPLDVREEIAHAPLGRFHLRVAALIGFIIFFEGYDTFNAAYVIHYVSQPWGLSPSQAGLLVSSGMIGFALGALAQGRFSDRYGRRLALLVALWIVSIFSLATAVLGTSFGWFCGCRLITGIGLGVLLPTGVTYLNEYAPRRLKNTFSTWGWNLGFSLGGVMASVVGVYLTPKFGWQVLYYFGSLSFVLTLLCHRWLPESLQFAALHGMKDTVVDTLARLNPAQAGRYRDPGIGFTFSEEAKCAGSVRQLLTGGHMRNTLSIWTTAFFVLFAIYGLTSWVPNVMIQRSGSFATSFALGAVMLGANFFGTLAFSHFADRVAMPRKLLFFWWVGGAVAVALLAVVEGRLGSIAAVAAAGFFVLGGQGGLNNLTATWHDTAVRGTAVGMMLGMGRIGGILGPYLSGLVQQVFPGTTALFTAIAIAILIAAFTIRSVRPVRHY